MATVGDITAYLEEIAPPELSLGFDNVGLLLGNPDSRVHKILVALDITDDVISEAIGSGAELIVSHHPLFMDGLKNILSTDVTGRKIIALLTHGISAVCMHTNLDAAQGGVNDALSDKLGAAVTGILNEEERISRIAELPAPMDFGDFLARTGTALGSNGLRYHSAGRPVLRIGVCGGSGGQDIALAFEKNCDTYVTADVKYHQFLLAKELGINIIDGDHFCTENVIVPVLVEKLSKRFGDGVLVTASRLHRQAAQFYVPG